MIEMTPEALAKVREFQASTPAYSGKAFRIRVDAGGCSGFTYDYSFDDPAAEDQAWEFSDITVCVDTQSLPFLSGSKVDYIEDFQGSGFQVINPNSTAACGCGKSFGV
jgi:iron-sulfur cluster assembly accessory protein